MNAEWSAECGADALVLQVPWSSPDGALHWVDLRNDPDALDSITEADEHPALLAALRTLNAARSPVFTAKCDAWVMDEEELAATRDDLMLDEAVAAAGFASYIDVVFRERAIFTSRHNTEQRILRLLRGAAELPHSLATLQAVMRPAVVELDGAVAEGFSVTLYVRGCGVDEFEAGERWASALRDAAGLFRGKEAGAR